MSARDPLPDSPAPSLAATTSLLRLVTAGSVDDGKSTLIGRLLYDSRSLLADQLDAVESASMRRGKPSVDLSLLTDGLEDERAQGITIDVAYRHFVTPRRRFIIGDAPGHEQYTRNLVTAASVADVAVVLVDARLGLRPQTRRHATLAALLDVETLVFAVNKIDLVDYDQSRYRVLEAELVDLAHDIARLYGQRRVETVPLSALTGANVVARETADGEDLLRWYRGPALLALLETLPATRHGGPGAPFRFPVQGVLRPSGAGVDAALHDFRAYTGRIEAGRISVGDRVTVLPAGRETLITGISLGQQPMLTAQAPASVMLQLADGIDVARGDWIVAGAQPELTRDLCAHLCWMSDRPLTHRGRYWLVHGTRTVKAVVESIDQRLDVHTLVPDGAESMLASNDIGRVRIRLAQPLPVEPYRTSRICGGFVLIDEATHDTVAAGLIAG